MPDLSAINGDIGEQLAKDALYANYIDRQKRDVEALKRDETYQVPADFDFSTIEGLSTELKQKLARAKPSTLAQAAKVDGMTPAALSLLLIRLRRNDKARSA